MNFKLKSINTNLLNVKKFKNIVTKEIDYTKENSSDIINVLLFMLLKNII